MCSMPPRSKAQTRSTAVQSTSRVPSVVHRFDEIRLLKESLSRLFAPCMMRFDSKLDDRLAYIRVPGTNLGIRRVRLGIAKDTAMGMKSLYDHGLQHRHLSSNSILLTSDYRAKVRRMPWFRKEIDAEMYRCRPSGLRPTPQH